MSEGWWKICPLCDSCDECENCDEPCILAMEFLNGQFND